MLHVGASHRTDKAELAVCEKTWHSSKGLRAELVPRFATYDNNGRHAASHVKIFADFPFIWNIRYTSQKSARKLKPDNNKNVET
jgi:hypothetical protein